MVRRSNKSQWNQKRQPDNLFLIRMIFQAESDKLPVIPVGFVRSEEVAGSAPHLVPGGNLACPSLEAQGMRIDSANVPISQVLNLTQVAARLQTSGDLCNHHL
ncbi:hypothetical protein NL676_021082 [Syzygium grande]|nr:hypothetical protein NL676_021082 [Syzygium grande]